MPIRSGFPGTEQYPRLVKPDLLITGVRRLDTHQIYSALAVLRYQDTHCDAQNPLTTAF